MFTFIPTMMFMVWFATVVFLVKALIESDK
jgi:hypothetical protein